MKRPGQKSTACLYIIARLFIYKRDGLFLTEKYNDNVRIFGLSRDGGVGVRIERSHCIPLFVCYILMALICPLALNCFIRLRIRTSKILNKILFEKTKSSVKMACNSIVFTFNGGEVYKL